MKYQRILQTLRKSCKSISITWNWHTICRAIFSIFCLQIGPNIPDRMEVADPYDEIPQEQDNVSQSIKPLFRNICNIYRVSSISFALDMWFTYDLPCFLSQGSPSVPRASQQVRKGSITTDIKVLVFMAKYTFTNNQGLYPARRRHRTGKGIPIIYLKPSDDRLRIIMGIPITSFVFVNGPKRWFITTKFKSLGTLVPVSFSSKLFI